MIEAAKQDFPVANPNSDRDYRGKSDTSTSDLRYPILSSLSIYKMGGKTGEKRKSPPRYYTVSVYA